MADEKWAGVFRPDRDCDGNGNTNSVRADRAEAALLVYAEAGGYGSRDGGAETRLGDPCVMQDFLCDLMHLRDRLEYEEEFDDLIESAKFSYKEER
jgi:hypothetical protein